MIQAKIIRTGTSGLDGLVQKCMIEYGYGYTELVHIYVDMEEEEAYAIVADEPIHIYPHLLTAFNEYADGVRHSEDIEYCDTVIHIEDVITAF